MNRRVWGFDVRLRPDSVWAGWRAPVAAGLGCGSAEIGGDFPIARPRLGSFVGLSIMLWTYTVAAGREPAVRAIVLAGVDLWDRHHGLSVPRRWIGGARGWLPRSKVSMITMGPPQQGQGYATVAAPGSLRQLHGSEIACPPVDQRCFRAPDRVRPVHGRIQADAGDPIGKQSSVLTCRQWATPIAAPSEQKFAGGQTTGREVGINRLSGLFGDLELNRSASFSLPYRGTIDGIAVRSDIFDLEADDIASAQLAVYRQIEQSEVSCLTG